MSSPLNFPNNPTPGQVYTAGDGSWAWDGTKWDSGYAAKMYLPLAGGTMTGPLVLSGNAPPTAPLQAIPLQQLNSTAALYLPLTGGTLTGPGNLSIAGTLGVTGATTLGVLTAGSSTLTALNVTGTTTLGASTLSSLTVTGTGYTISAPNGAISMAGNCSVGGTLVVGGMSVWNDNAGHLYCNYDYRAPNIRADGDCGGNRLYFSDAIIYNRGDGWRGINQNWRCTDFYSDGNVNTSGSLICNGMTLQNNSGFLYTPNSFYANGWISTANVFYVGGTGGPYWQNNSGWMYSPQGVWCANINTGPIQQNGNSVNGGGNYNSNGTAWGGWGAQYNWTGNGYWVAFQCTDAFYTYNNQSLAGGVYWTYCDERMKWNFRSVTRDCLAAINAIELRGFDFSEGHPPQRKTNPYETRNEHFIFEELPRKVKHIETGFIAQQLREIIPEAVPDPPQEGAFLSVDMRPMVATLIGAVQQLTARLKALEGK